MDVSELPEDCQVLVWDNYVFDLRHRMLVRDLRDLISFTNGQPSMILSPTLARGLMNDDVLELYNEGYIQLAGS
tara:strand:+ start:707 stop:928 length:222 start_codon:yes stop_codon:yes gene_type:complete